MNWFAFIKYTFAGILAFFLLSFGGIPSQTSGSIADTPAVSVAHAQEDTTYTFMQNVDLPGFGGESDTVNISESSLAEFVNTLIQLTIGFAILLAIIMVIAAGAEYMVAGSVTKKSGAKGRIAKALGGLFLALSAVVILQTINPNLIELDALEKINVEGDEISTPDFDDDLINNQTDGIYHCYDSDKSYTQLNWNKVCAETKSGCQDKMEIDNESAPGAVCESFLIFNGSRDGYGQNAQCAIFEDDRVECYSEANDPDGPNETVSNPKDSCEGFVDTYGPALISGDGDGCKPPTEIDLGSLDQGSLITAKSSGDLIGQSGGFVGDILYSATGTGESTNPTVAKEQAKNKCEDKVLEYAGKSESEGGTDVCSVGSGNKIFGCSLDGCDSAENTENALVYTCPRGDDNYSDPCSLSERRDCENCGSLTDSLSFTPGDHYRPDPRVCHDDYATLDNQCQINNDLAGKIDTLESNLDIPWTLNEAWPPTIRHLSQCHSVGTCVDIALRQEIRPDGTPITPYPNNPLNQNVAEHAQRVNTFIEAAENAGLTVKYEVGSDKLKEQLTDEGVPKQKIISIGVAPHFSVYRSQSDM